MPLKFDIIDPLNHSGWDDSLTSLPEYTFFYSSAWAKVIYESYHYTPTYFTLTDNSNLLALIPVMEINSFFTGRRGVSLPFTDYCEPIANGSNLFKDVLNYISICGKKRGWRSLELRGGKTFLQDIVPSSSYFRHTLNLSQNEGLIFSNLRDSTRRNIKKAISEGVEVKLCSSFESIKDFYRLNCMTRKEHGLPPQPYHFFKKVYECIISRNLGFVALASHKNKIIAGSIYFYFGDKAMYKYGASDRRYQHLRANNLVMWEAIRWYCENGYKSLCFGRTEPENTGLRQFKRGWGTQEHVINYYKYDLRKDTFIAEDRRAVTFYNNYNKIFNKIPLPLLKIAGILLYKHIG